MQIPAVFGDVPAAELMTALRAAVGWGLGGQIIGAAALAGVLAGLVWPLERRG